MKHISLENIISAVDGTLIGHAKTMNGYVKNVVIDSRLVGAGDMYIPIIGERFDGHDFIEEAFKAGAVLAFTSKEIDEASIERCLIHVEDTKIALGKLAAYYRRLFDIPIIGVTGSVGKTSTKEMMASILEQGFNVHKTLGNFNNDIGLPLTVLGIDPSHEVAVIELGMNHFGEIDYLANILQPTIGMIVNIGVSHIEFLGSREGILKAKCEMISHIMPGGTLILNGDDDLLVQMTPPHGLKTMYYGREQKFDCTMMNHQLLDDQQIMTVATQDHIYKIQVDYPGVHMLHNALGCMLIGEKLGLGREAIIAGVQAYKPAGMRLNTYKLKDGVTLIDDTYNASVDSMESALETLGDMKSNYAHSMAVLGSMFEMGDYARKGHLEVGEMVAKCGLELLVTVGKEAKWIREGAVKAGLLQKNTYHFEEQDDLINVISKLTQENTVLLLKGSRGMHLERTRDYLIESFEDVQ